MRVPPVRKEKRLSERARAREKECWSVSPCGFRMNRARTSVCVLEREWQWVSWSERKRPSGMRERFADWLAALRSVAWLERVRPLSGLWSVGSSSTTLERWSLPSIPRSLPSPLPPFRQSRREAAIWAVIAGIYANHSVLGVSRERCLFQTNTLADVLC